VNGDTLQNAGQVSFSSERQLDIVSAYTLAGRIDLALGFLSAPARIFFAENLMQFWAGQNVSTRPRGVVAGISDFGACEAWFAAYPSIVLGNPTATVSILHVRMELPFTVSPFTGLPATVKPNLITLAASAFGAAELTIAQLCYDEQNDRLLFISSLDGGLNYLPQIDPVSSEARLFLLDTPLIRDNDDALRAATGHYWVAAAYFDPPWRGAVLFSSNDGAVYVAADETLDAVAWGVARTALPDTDLPFQTDLTSQLQVTMVSGTGGELIDGSGEVPLAEDSEEYELEILDGPGGAVLRTETGITTTSFTYTSGMQSADFGGAQTELSFVVYQISAQVGRGFPGERTVEILP
jgi:hypothetical protein